jgi:hypothetical protein
MIKTALDTKECYAECHFYSISLMQIVTNHLLILSVVLFNVIMLSVVVPQGPIFLLTSSVFSAKFFQSNLEQPSPSTEPKKMNIGPSKEAHPGIIIYRFKGNY